MYSQSKAISLLYSNRKVSFRKIVSFKRFRDLNIFMYDFISEFFSIFFSMHKLYIFVRLAREKREREREREREGEREREREREREKKNISRYNNKQQ